MIMPNTLREKLAAGKPTIGTHYLSSDPDVPEIIGDSGLFNYAEYCAEYYAFDMQLLCHMARAGQCGVLGALSTTVPKLSLSPVTSTRCGWSRAGRAWRSGN